MLVYLIITGVFLITATAVSLIGGTEGTFDYPVVIEQDGILHTVTILDYISQGLILSGTMIIFIMALYLFYSLLLKHTMSALFALLGALLIGYVVTVFITWPIFSWLKTFQYLLAKDAVLYQNDQVWYQAIPITVLLSVVLLIITAQKIKNSRLAC